MEIEKSAHLILLYDFYGQLLTTKQKNYLELYYEQDLSLSEISEELMVSRQAVFDNIKRTEMILENYEEKLQLVAQYQKKQDTLNRLEHYLVDRLKMDDTIQSILNELRREEV